MRIGCDLCIRATLHRVLRRSTKSFFWDYCFKLKWMRKEIIKDEGGDGNSISIVCRWDVKDGK